MSRYVNPNSKCFDSNARCEYHSNTQGHSTENYWTLKKAIENLIEAKEIVVTNNEDTPNITNNPLPTHDNTHFIGMIYDDRDYKQSGSEKIILYVPGSTKNLEVQLGRPKLYIPGGVQKIVPNNSLRNITEPIVIRLVAQVPVTNTKAIPWNYNKTVMTYREKEIVEETNEMGGLTHSGRYYSPEELRKAKQARKSHLPISLLSLLLHSEEHCRVLIKTLNEAYVSEKTTVNQLETMAERFFEVNRITFSDDDLPEEGAGHNRALHLMLNIDTNRIQTSNVSIRSFDDSRRDTIGEIELTITIDPVDFNIVFQVLDMETSYNCLLGRSWIHMARVVPSNLYQMIKLEYDMQEVVVHGEDDSSVYKDLSLPCIEAKEGCESIIYQAFEVIEVDQVEEGKPILHPHLSATSMMKDTFGLGFKPTSADINRAKARKNNGWNLSKLIPHIAYSFVKPRFEQVQNPVTHDDIDEACQGLKEIFYEINMVQVGEGPSRASIQLIGPDTYNWEATPLPIRKESYFVKVGFKNMTCTWNSCPDLKKLSNLEIINQEVEYDEDEALKEIKRELDQFKNNPKPNINETEAINLGSPEETREIKISIHTEQKTRDAIIQVLFEYHHILMDKQDVEKTAFTTPWGTYCYRVMPFGLKNVRATYMRDMTTIFHDMMHKEIEVYVDDVIIKSTTQADHVQDLKKFFERLRRYNLKFGVPSGKLLGFIVSRRGIELDPSKIKTIRELPPPRNKTEVMSLLVRLNYISMFIVQLTTTCEPIFKLLKNNAAIKWTDECQEAFNKIKEICQIPLSWSRRNLEIQICLFGMLKVIGKLETSSSFHIENVWRILAKSSSSSSSEPDGEPWYCDIKQFMKTREYPEHANKNQKRTIRRLSNGFFLSGEILYKRTPNLNLLRCLDAKETEMIMNEVHSGVCGPHMNGYVLAKKILWAGYYWLTMERDFFHFVCKCHQCQIHIDLIHSPPLELYPMSAPWPFVAWGMDVIGPIEPKASNGHIFILVAIDYFTKWVEAITLKAVTKKTVVDFAHSNIICRFGIPKTIITNNAAN
ncbi:uncharacterized protein [Nicotiana tomentosiformis]|uniref:uncharacterized protein n=1 Tax=Nicotiana tomentosiformis TaxID=4098 RepID=UPI00388C5853